MFALKQERTLLYQTLGFDECKWAQKNREKESSISSAIVIAGDSDIIMS